MQTDLSTCLERIDKMDQPLKLSNRHASKSLSGYDIFLTVLENGYEISSVKLPDLQLEAGKDTLLDISAYLPKISNGNEYFANIKFCLKEPTQWAPKGFEIASNQFSLSSLPTKKLRGAKSNELDIMPNDLEISIQGKGFDVGIQ